jgi:hypothetical protein
MAKTLDQGRAYEPTSCRADTEEDDRPFLIVGKDDLGEDDRNSYAC